MKNILVTGCAGFIGSHASDLFVDHNYNVVGVDSLTYAADISNIRNCLKKDNFKFFQK